MQSGLPFLQSLLVLACVLTGALSLGLWMADTVPEPEVTGVRRWLGKSWVRLSAMGWRETLKCLNGWLTGRLNALVRIGFQDADRRVAFGGLIFALLFGFIPIAAAINALFGGSPFLFWYYLSLLAVLAILNFTGEWKQARRLSTLAAAYLGISLFLVIPVYVLRSFTEVTINNAFSHAVLKSFLVAAFWYLSAYGVGLMIDTFLRFRGRQPDRVPWARFVHIFLAALPVAYVLTFIALLAGHLAVGDQSPLRTWQIVLASTGLTALSLPVTMEIMNLSAAPKIPGEKGSGLGVAWAYALGLIAAAILSLVLGYGLHAGTGQEISWKGALNLVVGMKAGGGGVFLGPDFWVVHLPFMPLGVFVLFSVFGLISKAVLPLIQKFSSADGLMRKPFQAASLACCLLALLFGGGAALMSF